MLHEFFAEFEEYCKTPGIDSGKSRSYTRAIKYLFNFLKITEINDQSIALIKDLENDICDKESAFYQDYLVFLSGRKQKSYLVKGFTKASLKYFFSYIKK